MRLTASGLGGFRAGRDLGVGPGHLSLFVHGETGDDDGVRRDLGGGLLARRCSG